MVRQLAPADYNSYTGTLTIPAGSTSATVSLTINDDNIDEPNETFSLNATVTSGTTDNTNATGMITIIDNDDPPTVSISDETVDEGAGTVTVTVRLKQSVLVRILSLDLSTADGTATAPADSRCLYRYTCTVPVQVVQVLLLIDY